METQTRTRLRDLDIVRGVRTAAELRADDSTEGLGIMVVRFSPFEVWYEINSWWEGRFMERTRFGAFAKTIKERRSQIKTLFDHGYDFNIGGKILGTIEDLREDPDTALSEVNLFDTVYNRELLPGLRAGVYGSSFMFRVIRDEWNEEPGVSEHNPEGLPERSITEVKLFEQGPVTWPANPDATSGMRSLTDDLYERMAQRDAARVDALAVRIGRTRTSAKPSVHEGTADAANTTTDAPGDAHPSRSQAARARELVLLDL